MNKRPSAAAEDWRWLLAPAARLACTSMRQLVRAVPARWLARVGLVTVAAVTLVLVLGLQLDLAWHAAPPPGSCSETPH